MACSLTMRFVIIGSELNLNIHGNSWIFFLGSEDRDRLHKIWLVLLSGTGRFF